MINVPTKCLIQGGSTCDSLSDSGISDGDSEGAGGRARRLCALRELARRLQAALAPNSPAHRAIAKVCINKRVLALDIYVPGYL